MDRTWPTGCLKSFRTIATHTKFPISLLILHGKTLHDPNSTFNKIDAYQIRNSIADGLPEMALLQRDVMMQSQQKNILQQV